MDIHSNTKLSLFTDHAHRSNTHKTNLESRSSAIADRRCSPHIASSALTSFNPVSVSVPVSDVTAPSTLPIIS